MHKQSKGVKGRVAIITGAGRGIGKAIALKMGEAGAKVVAADIDIAHAQDTARIIKGTSTAIQVDVTNQESVDSLLKQTQEFFEGLDVLVNNAGVMFRTRFLDISMEEWEHMMRVNLTGPFLCTRAVLPVMKRKRFGRIVNISSSAGKSVSTLGGAHYTASKAGLLGLTRAVAKEAAPFGITVNAVCPGLIDTEMVRKTTYEGELQTLLDSFPINRIGSPEEVGELVVFLCSEKASYITGTSLDINGGDLMI